MGIFFCQPDIHHIFFHLSHPCALIFFFGGGGGSQSIYFKNHCFLSRYCHLLSTCRNHLAVFGFAFSCFFCLFKMTSNIAQTIALSILSIIATSFPVKLPVSLLYSLANIVLHIYYMTMISSFQRKSSFIHNFTFSKFQLFNRYSCSHHSFKCTTDIRSIA